MAPRVAEIHGDLYNRAQESERNQTRDFLVLHYKPNRVSQSVFGLLAETIFTGPSTGNLRVLASKRSRIPRTPNVCSLPFLEPKGIYPH